VAGGDLSGHAGYALARDVLPDAELVISSSNTRTNSRLWSTNSSRGPIREHDAGTIAGIVDIKINANRNRGTTVDMKLEVVLLSVSDVDRAKQFYESLGWRLDADFPISDDFRIVQLTPPGSACSIIFGTGLTSAAPGSVQGLQLVVSDIEAARAELAGKGVDVSEVFHDAGGVFHHAGTDGRVAGPAPDNASYGSFASFDDPDGNGWLLQEITERLPGR
jgi:catechol 2,3-dioxygenase-like lactoylglutathione lyase family enzyme